jgi:predicted Zn-dependent protease
VKLWLLCLVTVVLTAPCARGQDSAAQAAKSQQYVLAGDAALKAGKSDSARIQYENAVTADQDNIDATTKLATVLVDENKAGYAKNLLTRALRRHPTDPRLLHFRAQHVPVDSLAARYDSLLSEPNPSEETYRAAASEAVATGFYPRASGIVMRGLYKYPESVALKAVGDTVKANIRPQ